ncbi:MAG: sugar phosphate nucleotidyltransferase [Bacillota bacterium]
MQAVIMAGGKGTRLRPLTSNLPKPMVPLMGRPLLEYIIELLRDHGFNDIVLTLQHLPQHITRYFTQSREPGVRLSFIEETVALGTAGGVKQAEKTLNETFLVMSGDCFTDIDLGKSLEYHWKKGALATLVVTRVENPLAYGVIYTDESGRIIRFLEKPTWGEVFSDTINTGIYILEPEILKHCPSDSFFDFSKDLFPLLLQRGEPLYGFRSEGYWNDIGNVDQYIQTHFDILDGKARFNIPGENIHENVWVGKNVSVHPGAIIKGPVFLGDNCLIGKKAEIGPRVILGRDNVVDEGTLVRHTIAWDDCRLGKEGTIEGAVLGRRVTVDDKATISSGAVVGEFTHIGKRSILKPQVRLWPGKQVQDGTTVNRSVIWEEMIRNNLFSSGNIGGLAHGRVTIEFMARLGAAYGTWLQPGMRVTVGASNHRYSTLLKQVLGASMAGTGINIIDLGVTEMPVVRFATKFMSAHGGVYIRVQASTERVRVDFLDQNGINIDTGAERSIENLFFQEEFRSPGLNMIGDYQSVQPEDDYLNNLLNSTGKSGRLKEQFKVVTGISGRNGDLAGRLLAGLGCQAIKCSEQENLASLARHVVEESADLGVFLDQKTQEVVLVTDTGQPVKGDLLIALTALISFRGQRRETIRVPVMVSRVVEELASRYGGRVIRTKVHPRAWMELVEDEPFHPAADALYLMAIILTYMARQKVPLSRILQDIPSIHICHVSVPCSWQEMGKVMRVLLKESKDLPLDLVEGIKVYPGDASVLVLPDGEEPVLHIYSEADNEGDAAEWANKYGDWVKRLLPA